MAYPYTNLRTAALCRGPQSENIDGVTYILIVLPIDTHEYVCKICRVRGTDVANEEYQDGTRLPKGMNTTHVFHFVREFNRYVCTKPLAMMGVSTTLSAKYGLMMFVGCRPLHLTPYVLVAGGVDHFV